MNCLFIYFLCILLLYYVFLTYTLYFQISGNVKNTRALKASVQRSYIIPVVAKHCDGLVSKPTTVNIQVNEMCSNGWKGNYIMEDYDHNESRGALTKLVVPTIKSLIMGDAKASQISGLYA